MTNEEPGILWNSRTLADPGDIQAEEREKPEPPPDGANVIIQALKDQRELVKSPNNNDLLSPELI